MGRRVGPVWTSISLSRENKPFNATGCLIVGVKEILHCISRLYFFRMAFDSIISYQHVRKESVIRYI